MSAPVVPVAEAVQELTARVTRPQVAPMYQRIMNMVRPNRIRPIAEAVPIQEAEMATPIIRATLPPDDVYQQWVNSIERDPIILGIRANRTAIESSRGRRVIYPDTRRIAELASLTRQYQQRIRQLRRDTEAEYGSLDG